MAQIALETIDTLKNEAISALCAWKLLYPKHRRNREVDDTPAALSTAGLAAFPKHLIRGTSAAKNYRFATQDVQICDAHMNKP